MDAKKKERAAQVDEARRKKQASYRPPTASAAWITSAARRTRARTRPLHCSRSRLRESADSRRLASFDDRALAGAPLREYRRPESRAVRRRGASSDRDARARARAGGRSPMVAVDDERRRRVNRARAVAIAVDRARARWRLEIELLGYAPSTCFVGCRPFADRRSLSPTMQRIARSLSANGATRSPPSSSPPPSPICLVT